MPPIETLSSRKAWLITNHAPNSILADYASISDEDCIIAVDKGLEKVLELGLKADVLIGDLDSVDRRLIDPRTQVLSFPKEKNESDTELALLWALEQGFGKITICNDMAGRMDHALALIQNLLLCSAEDNDIILDSGTQLFFMLKEYSSLAYPIGSLLSIVALSGEAVFGASQGLYYPLDNLRLQPHLSRGLSNHLTASPATIHKISGTALAILSVFD